MNETLPDPSAGWDELYRERAHLVAHLSALYLSALCPATAESWAVVYIWLPDGQQLSWHVSAADIDLFDHVPRTTEPAGDIWDRHTTEEKYRRLHEATKKTIPHFLSERVKKG